MLLPIKYSWWWWFYFSFYFFPKSLTVHLCLSRHHFCPQLLYLFCLLRFYTGYCLGYFILVFAVIFKSMDFLVPILVCFIFFSAICFSLWHVSFFSYNVFMRNMSYSNLLMPAAPDQFIIGGTRQDSLTGLLQFSLEHIMSSSGFWFSPYDRDL